jgi:hypothetical protein
MEATCSSETSVDFQRTTWHNVPEDRNLHNHRCENLKSYILISGLAPYVGVVIGGYQCGFQRNTNSNIRSVQCETGKYGLLFYLSVNQKKFVNCSVISNGGLRFSLQGGK